MPPHRDSLPPLDRQREQLDGCALHSEQFLLYRVLDALTGSFFPILAESKIAFRVRERLGQAASGSGSRVTWWPRRSSWRMRRRR
jgi:hypothetical protein